MLPLHAEGKEGARLRKSIPSPRKFAAAEQTRYETSSVYFNILCPCQVLPWKVPSRILRFDATSIQNVVREGDGPAMSPDHQQPGAINSPPSLAEITPPSWAIS